MTIAAPFINEPFADFTDPQARKTFLDALQAVRKDFGKVYPPIIAGERVLKGDKVASCNPNCYNEVLGWTHHCGYEDIERAIQAALAKEAFWRQIPVGERATYLRKAAAIARKKAYILAAWQVFEVGKQWGQAYADVAEGIDFLEYYAMQAESLRAANPLNSLLGESNQLVYVPRGLACVIAPWNFPLAISLGMVAAALVMGNVVLYKPAEQAVINGSFVYSLFQEAGLPEGVLQFLPGVGEIVGRALAEDPRIDVVAFTGSKSVGLSLIQNAGITHAKQRHVKKVIAEMGGKNAIVVDEDADLDEVIPAVIDSAFSFQGQKCSACSRLIVLESVYETLCKRLVEAAESVSMGPPWEPEHLLGSVIDKPAQQKVLDCQQKAKAEGTLLYESLVPEASGFYVPIVIVGGLTPICQSAQEEVFGPLLVVMPVKDFEEGILWANQTEYGLTGGVFSRNPENIEYAKRHFNVGNLYINRSITGAMVGRQAFGGAYMSGTGTKAGGPEYLQHFAIPKVITENTLRRGFAQ